MVNWSMLAHGHVSLLTFGLTLRNNRNGKKPHTHTPPCRKIHLNAYIVFSSFEFCLINFKNKWLFSLIYLSCKFRVQHVNTLPWIWMHILLSLWQAIYVCVCVRARAAIIYVCVIFGVIKEDDSSLEWHILGIQ